MLLRLDGLRTCSPDTLPILEAAWRGSGFSVVFPCIRCRQRSCYIEKRPLLYSTCSCNPINTQRMRLWQSVNLRSGKRSHFSSFSDISKKKWQLDRTSPFLLHYIKRPVSYSWQISNDYISRMELENVQDIQGKISKIKEKKE